MLLVASASTVRSLCLKVQIIPHHLRCLCGKQMLHLHKVTCPACLALLVRSVEAVRRWKPAERIMMWCLDRVPMPAGLAGSKCNGGS